MRRPLRLAYSGFGGSSTHRGLRLPALLLVLEGVVDVERLVGDEKGDHVALVGGTVLHHHSLWKPQEASRPERSGMRLQHPVQHVDPMGAIVAMPWIGEAG